MRSITLSAFLCLQLIGASAAPEPINLRPHIFKRAACNADNCLRAVRGTAGNQPDIAAKAADCSSFFSYTETPCPATATSTSTVVVTAPAVTVVSSVTYEVDVTQTAVVTTTTTTTVVPNQKRALTTCTANVRSPSAVPSYASACSGTSRYSSACACISVAKATTTLPPSTVTSVVTVTSTVTPTTTSITSVPSTKTATTSTTTTVVATAIASCRAVQITTGAGQPHNGAYLSQDQGGLGVVDTYDITQAAKFDPPPIGSSPSLLEHGSNDGFVYTNQGGNFFLTTPHGSYYTGYLPVNVASDGTFTFVNPVGQSDTEFCSTDVGQAAGLIGQASGYVGTGITCYVFTMKLVPAVC